jgi:hypothetical protein
MQQRKSFITSIWMPPEKQTVLLSVKSREQNEILRRAMGFVGMLEHESGWPGRAWRPKTGKIIKLCDTREEQLVVCRTFSKDLT